MLTRREYFTAKSNAKRRGLAWNLSFEDWLRVWIESGHSDSRGRSAGEYQMDRIDPQKGYTPDNVQVISGRANRTKDSPHGWRPKLTEDAVRSIRQRHKPRIITMAHLANEFGVSKACIKAVLNGRNWSSVTP